MRLFHPDTAEHCVRTLEILSHKIHETLVSPDGTLVNLSESIVAEGISVEQFLRGSLLHDVGKIIVPRSILDNSISNAKWWDILGEEIGSTGHGAEMVRDRISRISGMPFNADTYKESLDERGVRPIQVCAIADVLSEGEIAEIVERGFPADSTILEIIMAHEEESRRILEANGFPKEAKLAGMHHNYFQKPAGKTDVSVEALRVGADVIGISMADIIHLADVTDALLNPRAYKGHIPLPKVLAVLIEHAKSGKVGRGMTYMWIKSELAKNKISEDDKIAFAEDLRAMGDFLEGEEVSVREKLMRKAA
jgi:hypothetical protein